MVNLQEIKRLVQDLEQIDQEMVETEKHFSTLTGKVHSINYQNACNLLHYLALRSIDIRDLQDRLHAAGLSSLASSESHIRGQLLSILQRLGNGKKITEKVYDYESSKRSLEQKAENCVDVHRPVFPLSAGAAAGVEGAGFDAAGVAGVAAAGAAAKSAHFFGAEGVPLE